MSKLDIAYLRQWIGRSQQASDIVTPQAIRRLRATLFRDPLDSGEAPLTTHWTLAPAVVPHRELAEDGHPARGDFLPPVPLPARMWAGGRLDFHDRLVAGDEVTRLSRIDDVVEKQGSTGALCFVTVMHEIRTPRGLAISERQDIVFRAPAAPNSSRGNRTAASPPEMPLPQHARRHPADEVALLRYSALTFNGHRIHYDQPYATGVEGYAGLLVHGPFQAALLAEFAADLKGRMPSHFEYRGVRPLVAAKDLSVNARETDDGLEVWTANDAGEPCMTGTVRW